MDSHLQRPYDIIEVENLNYVFTNKNGIIYHVYFIPLGHIYPQFDNTYSFSIEPEDSTPHPIDRRISATVVSILKKFFEKIENAMIMVCDNSDGRQRKRRNLFDRWYKIYNDGTMTSINAEMADGDYELLISIYMKRTNPNKKKLLAAFNELLTNDIYEIII